MIFSRCANRRLGSANRAILSMESLEARWNPANFQVTTAADAGPGSLRAAVADAEAAGAGNHVIDFVGAAVAADETISLDSQIVINANITIRGPAPGQYQTPLTIAGRDIGTGEERSGNRVFKIAANKTVAIETLRMGGGVASGADRDGGVIRIEGDGYLILRNSLVVEGFAAGDGGGIFVGEGGKLQLFGSNVFACEAARNGGGLALLNPAEFSAEPRAGTDSGVGSNTAGNDGGGIWLTGTRRSNTTPPVALSRLGVTSNTAGRDGAGIHFTWAGAAHNPKPIRLENCKIDSNVSTDGQAAGAWISGEARIVGGSINSNRARREPVSHYWIAGRVEEVGNIERVGNTVEAPPPPNDNDPQCAGYIASDAEVVAVGEIKYDGGFGGGPGLVSATTLRNAGILYPSDSSDPEGIGQVTVGGSYDQTGTGTLSIDLTNGAGDVLHVTGAGNVVSLAGGLDLQPHWATPPARDTVYVIIKNDTDEATAGYFSGLPDGYEFWVGGAKFRINYGLPTGDWNDVILTVITPPATITGRVFNDGWEYSNAPVGWDRDGIQNGNDGGYGGLAVYLLDIAGNVVASTTTDSSGYYTLTVEAAGQYRVRFTLPTPANPMVGYRFTAQDQGGNDAIDSDADATTGETALFSIDLGDTTHQDAGVIWRYNYQLPPSPPPPPPMSPPPPP